jgi:predicted NAD/FAD-dependent oxidoreductase
LDSKRVETIIIGAGITGAVLSYYLNSPILDKARMAGGRCSTGRMNSKYLYDKGATMYKNSFDYILNKKYYSFNMNKYLTKHFPDFKIKQIYENMFIPQKGMMSLVSNFINNNNLNNNIKISKITKENDFFIIKDELNNSYFADNCIITCPLPQALELMQDLPFFKEWEAFTEKYNHYKKTLVATGLWEDLEIKLDSKQKISELNHNEDLEYFTIESEKFLESQNLILSIQFSKQFSEPHFDNWMDTNKNLNIDKTALVENFFQSIFNKYNLKYISPKEIRAHRWKFSNPIVSMFDKDSEIDFDSSNYIEYIDLCKKHNLFVTGDWVYGQRAPKCILGAIQLSSIFLGKDLLSEVGSLP